MWSGVVRRSFAHLCFILNENCSQLCEMAAKRATAEAPMSVEVLCFVSVPPFSQN